jgi:hypothetical protein
MYPSDALASGDYFENDLPNEVTVDGVSFNRSGTGYGNTTNGVILEEDAWAKYRNGARSTRPCLIQGGVVDQFADTYAINDPDEGKTYTVNRISLCVWEQDPGIDENGDPIEQARLLYRSKRDEGVADNDAPIWVVDTPGVSGTFKKTGFQNTPIGTYSNPPSTDITVS